jgi:hypothetical protein
VSDAVEATATEAPVEAPAEAAPSDVKPVDAQGGQGPNEDKQADDSKLNALQRFAKQAKEKREARFAVKDAPADKPAGDAKPDEKAPKTEAKEAASKDEGGPQRDEHGRFLPSADKPKTEAKESAKAAAEPKEAPAPKPDPKPDAAVEVAKDKLEAAGVKPPEQKAAETDKQYELRISKLLLEKKQRDAELLETKQKLEPRAKRADELEKLHERLRGNEIDEADFEAATGRTFESFVKGLAKAEVKYKPKPQLAPEVTAELAEIRALKAELQADKERIETAKREAAEAKAKAERETSTRQAHEADAATCKTWLDEHADKYPYLSSVKNAEQILRDGIYAEVRRSGGTYDPDEVAEGIEKALEERLGTIASSERAIIAMLRDPKTRDLVSKQLGTVTQTRQTSSPQRETKGDQTAAAAGPPTLTNKVTQEVPAPAERELTPEEERLAYHARMRAANKAREAALKARLNPSS